MCWSNFKAFQKRKLFFVVVIIMCVDIAFGLEIKKKHFHLHAVKENCGVLCKSALFILFQNDSKFNLD